jgi:hypothetical protein
MNSLVTRVILWVPHVEQELLNLPQYLRSSPVLSGVRVTRFLVFYVVFCRSLFVPLSFFILAIVILVLVVDILVSKNV